MTMLSMPSVNAQQNFETSIEASINNGTNWSLDFNSSGCFHNTKVVLFLDLSQDTIILRHIKDGKEQSKIALTSDNLNTLIEFERQLLNRSNKYGGCTTIETYTVSSEFSSYTIKDSSCAWNGLSKLLKTIK